MCDIWYPTSYQAGFATRSFFLWGLMHKSIEIHGQLSQEMLIPFTMKYLLCVKLAKKNNCLCLNQLWQWFSNDLMWHTVRTFFQCTMNQYHICAISDLWSNSKYFIVSQHVKWIILNYTGRCYVFSFLHYILYYHKSVIAHSLFTGSWWLVYQHWNMYHHFE